MQITPSGTYPRPARVTPETATRAVDQPSTGVAAPAQESGAFTPTADLSRLLDTMRQTPDVRPGVVSSAADRLASGQLTTPEAARDAARAMLDFPE